MAAGGMDGREGRADGYPGEGKGLRTGSTGPPIVLRIGGVACGLVERCVSEAQGPQHATVHRESVVGLRDAKSVKWGNDLAQPQGPEPTDEKAETNFQKEKQ